MSEFERDLPFVELIPEDVKPVTVKFTTLDGHVFTQSYYDKLTVREIKTLLVDVFGVPAPVMELKFCETVVNDDTKLCEIVMGSVSKLDFELASKNSNYVISAEKVYQNFAVPDVITVKVLDDDEEYREVVVEIEDRSIVKPFLGGYVSRKTGIEYHHGYTQTGPLHVKSSPDVFIRDTQTYWTRNRKIETKYSRATQMSNENVYIPNVEDKILTSGPYETADEWERRRDVLGKVRTIQRYFRAWKLRACLKKLCEEYRRRIQKEDEEQEFLRRADVERKKREIIGKVFPRTKDDFSMLYSMVERWKKGELKRIISMSCSSARIAEVSVLLDKEIEMLQTIERYRKIVKDDMKIRKTEQFLRDIGDPLTWNSEYKNLPVSMDTLETQQGRLYRELYKSISNRHTSKEKHVKNLTNVRASLQDHNCEISNELVNLIDRACALLARGVDQNQLNALQMRIEALFLKHISTPECSFGVTHRLGRVKEKLMERNLFYCHHCLTLKTSEQFPLHSRTSAMNTCLSCSNSDASEELRFEVMPYRYVLRCIRRGERRQSSASSVAFILQEKDIHYIINKIWHSHSVISECDDVYKLRLCRWFKDVDWSPWNCLLVTEEEAKVHMEVRALDEVYDQEFLHHVYNKHVLAKKHFTTALQLESYYREIGQVEARWKEILDSKKFVAVNSKCKIFLSCH